MTLDRQSNGEVGRVCHECGKPLAGRQRKFCSRLCKKRTWRRDPDNAERDRETSRAWKAAHYEEYRASDNEAKRQQRTPCPACGGPMKLTSALCLPCHSRRKTERRAVMAVMWAEGGTLREIAGELGTTPQSIGVEMARARAEGSNAFPFRRRRKVAA